MLIGEVSRRSGVSTRMLRHYDSIGVVQPSERTAGGYREYSRADLRRLFQVEALRALGLTLEEARRALDDAAFTPDDLLAELVDRTRRRLDRERELLDRLGRIASTEPAEWADALEVVQLLRNLAADEPALRQRAVLGMSVQAAPADLIVDALLREDDVNVSGALRWALERADDDVLPGLAVGLGSPEVEVRRRAVRAVSGIPDPAATELLRRALADSDDEVRERAALAAASRGVLETVPVLLAMITAGRRDIEAAETLGTIARDHAPESSIVAALTDAFRRADDAIAADDAAGGHGEVEARAVRQRLVQALAEIPGDSAAQALTDLAGHPDRLIAATAASILRTRERGRRRR